MWWLKASKAYLVVFSFILYANFEQNIQLLYIAEFWHFKENLMYSEKYIKTDK